MEKLSYDKTTEKLLYLGVPAVSIFLLNSGVTDPVNTPKFFLLGVLAFALLSILIRQLSVFKDRGLRTSLVLVLVFMFFSTLTLFTSEAPFVQSLYGVYGRNNGFLTYFFLSIVLISASTVKSIDFSKRLTLGLLFAGLVNILYCGWVIIFGDFLSWYNPYKNILGTFGNPNFIGAFLGIVGSVVFAYSLSSEVDKKIRILLLSLIPVILWQIMASHAVQGRVLLASGFAIVGFFWIKAKFTNSFAIFGYLGSVLILGALALAGALQRGPLAAVIYKTSVSLRGQYWEAGWNTGTANPWSGVGFDSFGDWYRRSRDIRAIELPGVNTVVNTAHNVPLDIFAFGGWPLFVSYLALFLYTGYVIVRATMNASKYDPVFVSLVVAWTGYQLQSIISINQIGLAVWGWALSGTLVAYCRVTRSSQEDANLETFKKSPKIRVVQKPVFSSGLLAGLGMVIGALIAIPPLSADMKWMSARDSRSVEELEMSLAATYLNPQNSFKYVSIVAVFEGNALFELSHKYALEATKFNPSSYDSWRQLYFIKNSTASERKLALAKMKYLDPLNPDVTAP
jgi:O-antigen ligase